MASSNKKLQLRALKKKKERDEKRRQLRHTNRHIPELALIDEPEITASTLNVNASQDELNLRTSIQKFAFQKRFTSEFDRALSIFLDKKVVGQKLLDLDEATIRDFQEWYFFDHLTAKGHYLIDLFIQEIAPLLSQAQQEMVQDWARTNRLRLFEVQETTPGVGETIQDLVSDELLHCNDISMSRSARRWQILVARPLLTQGRWHFTGSGVLLTPMQKTSIVKFAKNLWEEYQTQHIDATIDAFYRQHGLQIRKFATELQKQTSNPVVVTREGHTIVGAKAEFQIEDEAEILDLLDESEEFVYAGGSEEREDAYHYNWLLRGRSVAPESLPTPQNSLSIRNEWTSGPGQPSYPTLGDLTVWPEGLELSCLSRERLNLGKQLLNELLGDRIQHRLDRFEDLNTKTSKAAKPSLAQQSERFQREAPLMEHEMMARQLEHWLETPVPGLNNQTPRQAAQSAEGRAMLREVLKQLEYLEAENPKRKNSPYSSTAIKRELGLV